MKKQVVFLEKSSPSLTASFSSNRQSLKKLSIISASQQFIQRSITNICHRYLQAIIIVSLSLLASNAQSAIIDRMRADMGLNEAPLMNTTVETGWTRGGYVSMGSAPRGDATPYWWTPFNKSLKSATFWKTIVPWFILYPGEDHSATNVRVKITDIKVYILPKSTDEYIQIDTGDGKPTWAFNYRFNISGVIGKNTSRTEPDGQVSFKLNSSFNPIHGGILKYNLADSGIDPNDINAIFVIAKTELILDDPDGIDDRANAQILFNIGADYYPTINTETDDLAPMKGFPAVGASRFGIVGTDQRTHYFSTIDPPGPVPRNVSTYVSNGGRIAIPAADLEDKMLILGCPFAGDGC